MSKKKKNKTNIDTETVPYEGNFEMSLAEELHWNEIELLNEKIRLLESAIVSLSLNNAELRRVIQVVDDSDTRLRIHNKHERKEMNG
jgi:hypothetical protein